MRQVRSSNSTVCKKLNSMLTPNLNSTHQMVRKLSHTFLFRLFSYFLMLTPTPAIFFVVFIENIVVTYFVLSNYNESTIFFLQPCGPHHSTWATFWDQLQLEYPWTVLGSALPLWDFLPFSVLFQLQMFLNWYFLSEDRTNSNKWDMKN